MDHDLSDADENYHESSDEDFNPIALPADQSSSSSEEEEAPAKPAKGKAKAKGKGRGKRKAPADEALDSGDEVTIEAARKRRKKGKGSKNDEEDDLLFSDAEGDGGLVKTRAQRKEEQRERKPLARTDGATVDVDALWAQMSAAPLQPLRPLQPHETDGTESHEPSIAASGPSAADEEDQVTVKKVYTFAGQRTTEEKQIPRSKLQQFISDGWKALDSVTGKESSEAQDTTQQDEEGPKIRRPLRRPSRFDANPTGFVRALPPEHQLSWPRKSDAATSKAPEVALPADATKSAGLEKAQKLNVVDKSRLDWTGFVDKEGIAEELDTHGKTKEAYLGRMEFLAGVEARREEERRRAKAVAMS